MAIPIIEINEKYCKGCGICVTFCPAKVLALENFKAKAIKPEACVKCMQCELRCPDFAIRVS